jgi:hypothetical protein
VQYASGALHREQKPAWVWVWVWGYFPPSHSKKQREFEFECEDILLLHTQKKQSECGFELVRLWSMWRKGQSEAFVLKLTLTLAFVPFARRRSYEIIADPRILLNKIGHFFD